MVGFSHRPGRRGQPGPPAASGPEGRTGPRGDRALASGVRVTERLRLDPIGSEHADELWRLHRDPGVARWYGGRWTRGEAWESALHMGHAWEVDGVHKWIAHDRGSGELVGRGGLSYAVVDCLRRLEIGWAVRERFWGLGYASEIGRAGLTFAFDDLDADEVVSFTEVHNRRSRAVMERLGFHFVREIRHGGEPFALYLLRRP
ncbi:GNAT family N-acetyltransferase [Nocardiopsis halotolerans]|uniref:GNAT family N-acetyltransferase n=1 Tax=Nocardiopsis halotolerans TaxID=124252 RepID=UPI00034C87EB|nr:GNAT family N-acetyltransferase [Nocardiopsis halotolerans]